MSPRLLRPRASGASAIFATDADARAYIAAVNAADGQPLEQATQLAIDAFVIGCKADGIWSAIKASCILMGARTLSGALTPLVGAAPTNFNFVSGDYNRKTGLVGNGSTKYLDSNRSLNSDPQNNFHLSVYITTGGNNQDYLGDFASGNGNLLQLFNSTHFAYARGAGVIARTSQPGFFGAARSTSSAFTARGFGSDATNTSATSVAPPSRNSFVFARNTPGGASSHSVARLAFYSIGESLSLAALDSRLTTLYNAIGAAIP
jgi:hypothetical protein